MREIKFRCWYDNQMHKVVDIDFSYKRINLFAADIINFEDGVLMQYTGLKDKNGKEIYEGDILKNIYYQYSNDEVSNKGFKEEILKVVYRGCGFIFEKIKINEIEMPKEYKEEFIEVIGNIYENPELLED